MCDCVDVEIGSYDNQIKIIPFWKKKSICIDKCLKDEIIYLWDQGIKTTGCCCGHNKVKPMINVNYKSEERMLKLGYEFWVNQFGVKCYKPYFDMLKLFSKLAELNI